LSTNLDETYGGVRFITSNNLVDFGADRHLGVDTGIIVNGTVVSAG